MLEKNGRVALLNIRVAGGLAGFCGMPMSLVGLADGCSKLTASASSANVTDLGVADSLRENRVLRSVLINRSACLLRPTG